MGTLRDYFCVMHIEEDDLEALMDFLDVDGDGSVSYEEFHMQLYKMKTLEPKTYLFYAMTMIRRLARQVEQQGTLLEAAFRRPNTSTSAQSSEIFREFRSRHIKSSLQSTSS